MSAGENYRHQPPRDGLPTEVLFDDNMPVKAGQVLIRLSNPRDFRMAVEKA